ncbi:MAG TPA: NAD-dependent epimerase/dehydratase family protein [Bacillota bacterium]|nr:NAD-dependent epimerase/dehydratase family protein [Bacillota bacterium]
MKSAVITGANGFVGRALTEELRRQGIRVLAVARGRDEPVRDAQTVPPESNLAQIVPVTLDLARLAQLPTLTEERWDVFYHLAWSGTSGEGRKDINAQLFNIEASVEAVRVAKSLGCSRFIGAGSIMEREILAASAEPQARPGSGHIYSAAKLAAHQMSRCMAAELGISHIWAAITNAYGEGEASPRLLNTILRKILRDEELSFTSAVQNYDFIHVEDVARAFRLLGQRGTPFAQYTVGSGRARPLRDFLRELYQTVIPDREPSFGGISFEGVSLPLEAFDTAPLYRDTGFVPEIGFPEGICRTMSWLRQTLE